MLAGKTLAENGLVSWLVVVLLANGTGCNRPQIVIVPREKEVESKEQTDADSRSRFLSSPEAPESLARIRATMASSQEVSPADHSALVQMQATYPGVLEIEQTLTGSLALREDWDGLIQHFDRLEPDRIDREVLIRAHIRSHRYSDAIRLLGQRAGPEAADDETKWLFAFCHFHAGDYATAGPLLDGLADRVSGPRLLDVLTLRGLVAIQADDLETARRYLERALAAQPDHLPAVTNLARVMHQLGDPAAAAELDGRSTRLRQQQVTQTAAMMRLAALAPQLEEAWSRKDLARTKAIVDRMMPDADAQARAMLNLYLVEIRRLNDESQGASGR